MYPAPHARRFTEPAVSSDWVFERSSGYAGYRNRKTGDWIYESEFDAMNPDHLEPPITRQLRHDLEAVKRIHPDGTDDYAFGFLEAQCFALAGQLDAIRNAEGIGERAP